MQRFIGLIRDEHRKGHFPKVWDPSRAQKACLLSPDTSSTVSPATSSALPLPDVHTIDGLQEALKMFGYRIALMATTAPKQDKSSPVSRCALESSLMKLRAHRRKRNYSAS